MRPRNFLIDQYAKTNVFPINHNYLREQFENDVDEILEQVRVLVGRGDYTLGASVQEFESNIRNLTGSGYAIGVGSGTDALMLSLIGAGIGHGDEVITTPYTFHATLGAIVTAGARPVFVDIADDLNIDVTKIEDVITPRTRAILPVHWAGLPCEMEPLMEIANRNNLVVVEDSCHAIGATYKGTHAGRFGLTGCFSMHPLKNLNVWGDGGFIITESEDCYNKLLLLRNHGLINRDECAVFAYNSRLDTIQAIVANHLLQKIPYITERRTHNAHRYDAALTGLTSVEIPHRSDDVSQVFHLYIIRAEGRDPLKEFLNSKGVDAKVHYPIPMHLQPAARYLQYQRGDFPMCEEVCDSVISLPVHEFIEDHHIDHVVNAIREFYDES